jgi:uncharacterized protein
VTPLADSSFVVAVANSQDKAYVRSNALYDQFDSIYLPQSTLAEVAYFLTKLGGNRLVAQFLNQLSNAKFQVIPLLDEDLRRTAELLQRYADTRLDFVDATIVAMAERLGVAEILTLDRRDFSLVRPRHTDYFTLLPE